MVAHVEQLGTLHGQKLQKGEQKFLDVLQSYTNSRRAEEIVIFIPEFPPAVLRPLILEHNINVKGAQIPDTKLLRLLNFIW